MMRIERKTVNDMMNLPFSIEKYHEESTRDLIWGYTDVLYSFLGIYVIGLKTFYKNDFECSGVQIKPKRRENNNRQIAYSNTFIKRNYSSYDKLNNLDELTKFIEVYSNIGNIIPIWPGGNEHRGKSQCYDIPDIYFNGDNIKGYSDNFFNTYLKYKNVYLIEVLESRYTKIEEIIGFNEEEYKEFLKYIVDVINNRTVSIKDWLKENEDYSSDKMT